MAKSISGISNAANLKQWSNRASEGSFHTDKSETKHNIGCDGCKDDYESGIPDMPRQKSEEGKGYAPIDKVTQRNTYTTTDGGTKR